MKESKRDLPKVKAIVKALLAWFAREARDLPWRRTRDPYAIWVSEVMLQQTHVQTVIPYWTRWMAAMPTVRALAEAEPEVVLKLWEGLGYYSRARNLQRAAQVIVERHGGQFPATRAELLELPGVGPYTAGAVSSIAFDLPEPILDGNITRVLTRLFAWQGNPKSAPMQAKLWNMARQLVEAAGASSHPTPRNALNQALMELGATLCSPRDPDCPRCPLKSQCLARRAGISASLPTPAPKVKITVRHHVVFLFRHQGRYWVRQRPTHGGVNAGMWEFPTVEVEHAGVDISGLARAWAGVSARTELLGLVDHNITRYRHRFNVCHVEGAPMMPAGASEGCWRAVAELEAMTLAGAHRKIVRRFIVDNDG